MSLEKDKLMELPAEARIKKLRQLEEESKKQAQEVEKLLKISEQELSKNLEDALTNESEEVNAKNLAELIAKERLLSSPDVKKNFKAEESQETVRYTQNIEYNSKMYDSDNSGPYSSNSKQINEHNYISTSAFLEEFSMSTSLDRKIKKYLN